MNNLERMKKEVISQIEKMDVSQFEELVVFVIENYIFEYSVVLTCSRCQQEYGRCPESATVELCEERFRDYASREA